MHDDHTVEAVACTRAEPAPDALPSGDASPSLPERRRTYRNHLLDSTRWDAFPARDGDIVVATSYKAGSTLMQAICAALVFADGRPPARQDQYSPWLEARFVPRRQTFAALERQAHRRIVKTHLPLDALPFDPRLRYVVVGRDGPDVFMSLWRHWNNLRPEGIRLINALPGRIGPELPPPPADIHAAFADWLERGGFAWERDGFPFWSHLTHARSWWDYRHLPNVRFMHFADLLRDLDGEMRGLARWLGVDPDPADWPVRVGSATFGAMKADAESLAPYASLGLWKDTADFFHGGRNGRWQGVLHDAAVARYRMLARDRLGPELARWLQHGRARAT
jgi:aryl sulfotransferase